MKAMIMSSGRAIIVTQRASLLEARLPSVFSLIALLSMLSLLGSCGGGDSSGPTTVTGRVSSVELAPATLTIGVGGSAAIELTALDGNGAKVIPQSVFWSSSDATVARVSSSGLVTALQPGAA